MAGVTVKMGVTGVAEFKKNIQDAEAAINSLNESLKLNEAQLKLNGNQELYLSNKVQILKDKIAAQTQVVKAADTALQSMKDKGVDPASKKFLDMQTNVYKATTKLTEMKTELKDVENNGGGAAEGLTKTEESLKSLDESKAWDNAAKGLDKLTSKLEKTAKSATRLGKKMLKSVKDVTGWADDLLADAMKMDTDAETLQRMENVADIIDTSVDAIVGAKKRIAKAAAGEGAEDIEDLFGISVEGKDPTDLMWEIGDALLNMGDDFDKEAAAQKVFGRNWNELLPLFKTGREEYEKMLAEQHVLTNEQVQSLGKADDKIKELEKELETMKRQLWSDNADKITGLMQWIIDNSEAVKAALVVIAGGFAMLKLADFAANLGKTVNGLKKLKLIDNKTANAAQTVAKAAGGTGGTASTAAGGGGNAKWMGFLKDIGFEGVGGIAGVASILAGFGWAAYRRNFEREKVRGTDEYLTAQSAGVEQLLADWIRANQAMSALETKLDATAEEVDAVQARIDATKAALDQAEGGTDAIKAYSDWRQERSLGNMDWTMPDDIDKMSRTIEESFAGQTQSNSEMTAAANELKGLPAAVGAAVRSGMSGVTIVINEGAVGAIGRRIGGSMANSVAALVK